MISLIYFDSKMTSKYVTSHPPTHLPDLDPNAIKHIFPQDRFINNPTSKHILTEDIYSSKIGQNGELSIKTFLVKTNSIPLIFQKYWPNCPIRIAFVEEMRFEFSDIFRFPFPVHFRFISGPFPVHFRSISGSFPVPRRF